MDLDNKQRFSNRVDTYVKYRPDYPMAVFEYMVDKLGVSTTDVVADIGSGTGKFTVDLLSRGYTVLAVEPNAEMRQAAEQLLSEEPGFRSIAASAEATTLDADSVDWIVSAQAFHWFDAAACRQEFRRILRPEGQVILIWNKRHAEKSEFLVRYEQLLKTYGEQYEKLQHRKVGSEELREFYGAAFEKVEFPHEQRFDLEGLKGRAMSSSYVPLPGDPNYAPLMEELNELFHANEQGGFICFEYTTEVYSGPIL